MQCCAKPVMPRMVKSIDTLASIVGTQRAVAEIIGLSEEQISRIANGSENEPGYLIVIAELVAAIDPNFLPERWKTGMKNISRFRRKRKLSGSKARDAVEQK